MQVYSTAVSNGSEKGQLRFLSYILDVQVYSTAVSNGSEKGQLTFLSYCLDVHSTVSVDSGRTP